MRWSWLVRLQAIGMFHTTAILTRALTSESCGCGLIGSQKKISMSRRPDAISAPICWSPPSGRLWKQVTGKTSRSPSSLPVVPVAYRVWSARMSLLYSAHSRRSLFLSSWATRAMRFWASTLILPLSDGLTPTDRPKVEYSSGAVVSVMPPACRINVASLPRERYRIVYIAWCRAQRRAGGGCGNLEACVLSGCSLASRADLLAVTQSSARPLLVRGEPFLLEQSTPVQGPLKPDRF